MFTVFVVRFLAAVTTVTLTGHVPLDRARTEVPDTLQNRAYLEETKTETFAPFGMLTPAARARVAPVTVFFTRVATDGVRVVREDCESFTRIVGAE